MNLGLLPLFADASTRAVVALEMMFTEIFWVPTINGDYYYKKPPLYNWIITAVFYLTGSMSEFVFRLPSVVPLFLFGFSIYKWSKKFIGQNMAFLAAGMFVTCGRMLVYASFIGHIDIFYSWVTFLSFICLIKHGKEGNWTKFFVYSYALSAVAFLCKGLPTVLFQGISIIVVLLALKKAKKFFSLEHLLGLLVFTIPVGGYFLKYYQFNKLDGWVEFLWTQSKQRTVMDKAWYESVIHIFKFPLDHLYHLAPWSLFAIFMFRKGFKKELWNTPELKLLTLIFLANLPVYWLSPGYYPRYLFMLYPLLFIVVAFSFKTSPKVRLKKYFFAGFTVLGIVFMVGVVVIFILKNVGLEFSALQCGLVLALASFSIFLLRGLRGHLTSKLIGVIVLMASVRLLFNYVVMPDRLASGKTNLYKTGAIKIAKQTQDTPLKIVRWTAMNHDATFYIERERQKVLYHTLGFDKENLNLMESSHFTHEPDALILDSMQIRHENRIIYLVKDGK